MAGVDGLLLVDGTWLAYDADFVSCTKPICCDAGRTVLGDVARGGDTAPGRDGVPAVRVDCAPWGVMGVGDMAVAGPLRLVGASACARG